MKEADIIRDSEADPGSKPEEVDVDRLLGEFVQLRIDQTLVPLKSQVVKVNKELDKVTKSLSGEIQHLILEEEELSDKKTAQNRVRDLLVQGLKAKFLQAFEQEDYMEQKIELAGRKLIADDIAHRVNLVPVWADDIIKAKEFSE